MTCTGNPYRWERPGGWSNCAAEPVWTVVGPRWVHGAPAIVMLAACEGHCRSVKVWLETSPASLSEIFEVLLTEDVVEHYDEIFGGISTPVMALVSA